MTLSIGQLVAKRAEISPGKEAFVEHHRNLRLTFSKLDRRVNRTANMLAGLGITKGDRVSVLMANSAEFMDIYYALAKLGAVCVPLNWRLAVPELAYILADSDARALIYDGAFDAAAARLREPAQQLSELTIFIRNADDSDAGAHDFRSLC
ncbi:MAG: AMP-binding protein, partial [Alphaproteobacteria bacterium]|nr:AMP-binding protein [Alphaproteobacteria bacterium]